jgi:8-oxo-dGTP diphosphatase
VVSACRPRGFWLPGGGILPGESPEDAVKREALEELGRAIHLTDRVGEAVQYFDSPADGCWYEMTAYFFAAEFDGEPQRAGEEQPSWLDPDSESGSFFHASHAWAVSRAKAIAAQSALANGQVPPASV